jgi:hypothetical protein
VKTICFILFLARYILSNCSERPVGLIRNKQHSFISKCYSIREFLPPVLGFVMLLVWKRSNLLHSIIFEIYIHSFVSLPLLKMWIAISVVRYVRGNNRLKFETYFVFISTLTNWLCKEYLILSFIWDETTKHKEKLIYFWYYVKCVRKIARRTTGAKGFYPVHNIDTP